MTESVCFCRWLRVGQVGVILEVLLLAIISLSVPASAFAPQVVYDIVVM